MPVFSDTSSSRHLGEQRRELVQRRSVKCELLKTRFEQVDLLWVLDAMKPQSATSFYFIMNLISAGLGIAWRETGSKAKVIQVAELISEIGELSDSIRRIDYELAGPEASAVALWRFLAPTTAIPRGIDETIEVMSVRLGYGGAFIRPGQAVVGATELEQVLERDLGFTAMVALRIVEAIRHLSLVSLSSGYSNVRLASRLNLADVTALANEALYITFGRRHDVRQSQVVDVLRLLSESIPTRPADKSIENMLEPFMLTQQMRRPIRLDERTRDWYCIAPHLLPYAWERVIAERLAAIPESPLSDRVKARRGRSLEDAVEATLSASLGAGKKLWRGIRYHDAQTRELLGEIDVIAHLDDHVLLVECKSGNLRDDEPASLRRSLNNLGTEPSKQLRRLVEALDGPGAGQLFFSRADDRSVISPGDSREIRDALSAPLRICLVITLDDLGALATYAQAITRVKNRPSVHLQQVPLSMSFTDLRTVVDLLDGGHLVTYLLQRQYWIRLAHYFPEDEAGQVSIYLQSRLSPTREVLEAGARFGMTWRADLSSAELTQTNTVYRWREQKGQGSFRDKPRPDVAPVLAELLKDLSQSRPPHWSTAYAALLSRGPNFEKLLESALTDLRREVAAGTPEHPCRVLWGGHALLLIDYGEHDVAIGRTSQQRLQKARQITGHSSAVAIHVPRGSSPLTVSVDGYLGRAFAGEDADQFAAPSDVEIEQQRALTQLFIK